MQVSVILDLIVLISITDTKYLMITGQFDENEKMEVLDGSTNVTSVCASSSHQYPLVINDATGALVGNKIIVCGGYSYTSSCYEFSHDHNWKLLGEMNTKRSSSASIPIPNGLWVTGGYDGHKRLDSTEIVLSNGTILNGPPLPEPRSYHCLLQYKNTTFLIGGYGNGDRQSTVWIFKEGMKYVGDGPMMTFARYDHACGIYHSSAHDGNPIIVISGGLGSRDTSEFWDFTVPGSKWILTSKSSAFIVSF